MTVVFKEVKMSTIGEIIEQCFGWELDEAACASVIANSYCEMPEKEAVKKAIEEEAENIIVKRADLLEYFYDVAWHFEDFATPA